MKIIKFIKSEPVAVWSGLLGILITLLCQLGLPIDDELAATLNALLIALLAIISRAQVTPLKNGVRRTIKADGTIDKSGH